MSLENFRKVRIQLHRADEPILHKLVAKEGDYNGRELEVQLTNRYVLENQQDVTLRLYWRHLKHGNQGIENFEAVEVEKGLFKVNYPSSMLSAGLVQSWIQIQDGNKLITTNNFIITVEGSGFDAQTAIASDDYMALSEALIKINQYQSEIDAIKLNLENQVDAIIRSNQNDFNLMKEEYEPLLIGLQNQFDDVMANLTVDSELIATRSSTTTGRSYTAAGNRLDEMEERQIIHNLDTNKRNIMSIEVKEGRPRIRLEEV